ncbi:hypothetical protein FCR2A7T_26200 [Flavobacterium cauense R2A-7]|uniref:Uncharacterized protein n=1 Tax=Flavobacterium cauense R2A-7 TaxID=1341154 RepID=V6RYV4_9FLAO|nr:hypothetical protein [Flavobacterium cauense]ESU19197.1 hypothetical protein FCR2A7T_26200 [Flavobacterium cauense R2A-7]KGO82180.1 hypothetical protein Q762_05675 [Flavobacterium cauense R2A-7]TWI15133.1 hypothetical protein IP98_00120 [Flavobacterium cauense R2A-7]
MVSKEDLEKRYAALSNKELLDILENKFSYTELALTVALEEISRRKLNENDIKAYKNAKVKEFNTFIRKNIIDDLSFFQKLFFFFIWIPFLNFPIRRNFMDYGFVLKLKQASYYSWTGFIFCIAISIVSSNYFDFSNITFIIIWMICFIIAFIFDESFNRRSQIIKLQRYYSNPESKEETQKEENDETHS